jgi:glycosyltransferase involved in cell wall biosynthesis
MKTENQPGISVVLPCYNPLPGWCGTLEAHIRELNAKLPDRVVQYIVSNDGSTRLDRTKVAALSRIPNVIFLDNAVNEGKGSAIRKGTLRAEGDIIVYTDIDFPFGTDPIVEMVKIFHENPHCWFVYGNRSAEYFKKLPLKRRLFSKGLHLMNRLFLNKHITDTQAGIKGLRREILPEVQGTKTNTFVFEVELIRKLIRKGIGMEKVEVSANSSIVFSDFSMKVLFREAINFARITILGGLWNDLS